MAFKKTSEKIAEREKRKKNREAKQRQREKEKAKGIIEFTVKLDKEALYKLDYICNEIGVSRNLFIKQLINNIKLEALEHFINKKKSYYSQNKSG